MKKIFKILIILFTLILILLLIDKNNTYHDIRRFNKIEIYDDSNNIIYSTSNNKTSTYVKSQEIPNIIKKVFVISEDKRFYHHSGFDIYRISKSIFKHNSGASTITQQYIKNAYLTNEKTIIRKLKELYLSIRLERDFNKEDILEIYLNSLYFGKNIYGIKDAAFYYFNKDLYSLTIDEIAILANIIKNPTKYNPINNKISSLKKRNNLLRILYSNQVISKQVYEHSIKRDIYLNITNLKQYPSSIMYFKDIVLHELNSFKIHKDYNQTIRIYTRYNKKLNETIENKIKILNKETTSFIMLDNDGFYISTIGGKDYYQQPFNVGITGNRQIASTAKPILYYDSIIHGYRDLVLDCHKKKFKINGQILEFKNYNDRYETDPIDMGYALATSDNMYALQMQVLSGLNGVSRTLNHFGINEKNSLDQALGTTQMSLNQLLKIYYTFQNQGKGCDFKAIDEIYVNKKLKHKRKIKKKQILDSNACIDLSILMNQMFDTSLSRTNQVTGKRISKELHTKISGKSGLDDYNSYMIGFNDKYLIGSWVGYLDMTPLTNITSKSLPKILIKDAINTFY